MARTQVDLQQRVVLALVGAACAAALAACGGTEVATEASLGDCFQNPETVEEVGALEKVDCDEPHDNEVFAVFDLEDGDFPGVDEVQALAEEGCAERFEGYVGTPYEESDLNIFSISPTEETWEEAGDREVICAAYPLDDEPLEGSVEGSER